MPQSNAVEIAGLDHINIQTPVLEDTCAFFEKIVGLKRGFRPDFPFPGAWLYLGEKAVVHVNAFAEHGLPPRQPRHAATHPKSRGCFVRSMELFRGGGQPTTMRGSPEIANFGGGPSKRLESSSAEICRQACARHHGPGPIRARPVDAFAALSRETQTARSGR